MGVLIKLRNKRDNQYIVGVVNSRELSGSLLQGQEIWTFSFTFYAWYGDAKVVSSEPLYVYKEMEHSNAREWMHRIKKESLVKIRISNGIENNKARLIDVVATNFNDELLNPYLEEIKKEVTYEDERLGKFVLDKGVKWFSKEFLWCSNKAELAFNTSDINDLKRMIKDSSSVIESDEEWDNKAKNFAATKLLELKNDFWLDEDEEELTHEDFLERLQLETLNIKSDGGLTFWYDDGDLFAGHVLIVEANVNGDFINAEIAG